LTVFTPDTLSSKVFLNTLTDRPGDHFPNLEISLWNSNLWDLQGFKIPQVRRLGLTNFEFRLHIYIRQESRDLALSFLIVKSKNGKTFPSYFIKICHLVGSQIFWSTAYLFFLYKLLLFINVDIFHWTCLNFTLQEVPDLTSWNKFWTPDLWKNFSKYLQKYFLDFMIFD
jgi:hypothetical protein